MTTPDLQMPYTLSLSPGTPYWLYMIEAHRQPGRGTPGQNRHFLPRGEYQIMVATKLKSRISLRINNQSTTDTVLLESTTSNFTGQRVAMSYVTIRGVEGDISFSTSLIAQADIDNQVPVIVTVIPLESYKP